MATNAEAHRELSRLYDVLEEAYWDASTVEGKDLIMSVMNTLSAEIDRLDIAGLRSNNAAYEVAASKMAAAQERLQELADDIDKIVKKITTARQALEQIQKVWGGVMGWVNLLT